MLQCMAMQSLGFRFRGEGHKLHFLESVLRVARPSSIREGLRNEPFRLVLDQFQANYERAMTPVLMVPWFMGAYELFKAFDTLVSEFRQKLDDGNPADEGFVANLRDELQTQVNALVSKVEEPGKDRSQDLLEFLECHNLIRHGLETNLASVVVNAWTAFEVAATDIWSTAIDIGPLELQKRAISGEKRPKQKGLIVEIEDRADPAVLKYIQRLQKLGKMQPAFNIEQTHRFNFVRLWGIREAYCTTFDKSVSELFSDENIAGLFALEGVRNGLVHNGGIADEQFVARIRDRRDSYKPFGLEGIKEGDSIKLDGRLVGPMLTVAGEFTCKLLGSVDKWITDNP